MSEIPSQPGDPSGPTADRPATTGRAPGGLWDVLCRDAKGLGKDVSQDRNVARVTAGGRAAVLAVANGHGSAARHRGDLGARWAVEEFARCAEAFAERAARDDGPAARDRPLYATAGELPRRLVGAWRQRVARHECNAPADGRPRPGGAPPPAAYEVYDTTLMGAVVTPRLLVCWQLGGGDFAVAWEGGQARTPLYAGPDAGGETESLCQPEAWLRTRVHWQPLANGGAPPAVLLSTDGLASSFTDRAGFLGFVSDVRARVAREGAAAVAERLTGWLATAATRSHDDTTLVAAFPPARRERRQRAPGGRETG